MGVSLRRQYDDLYIYADKSPRFLQEDLGKYCNSECGRPQQSLLVPKLHCWLTISVGEKNWSRLQTGGW